MPGKKADQMEQGNNSKRRKKNKTKGLKNKHAVNEICLNQSGSLYNALGPSQ